MSQQTAQNPKMQIVTRALQDESFKQQLLSSSVAAKAAIEQEFGQKLPESLEIKVLEETANAAYIVLPRVVSTEELSEEELESVAGGVNWLAVSAVAGVASAVKSWFDS